MAEPTPTEADYRAAAEAAKLPTAELFPYRYLAAVKAAYAAGHRAGRQAAADAILAHADQYLPLDGSNAGQRTTRRYLMTAVQIASPKATLAEIGQAIKAGDCAACRLDAAGRSIPREEETP